MFYQIPKISFIYINEVLSFFAVTILARFLFPLSFYIIVVLYIFRFKIKEITILNLDITSFCLITHQRIIILFFFLKKFCILNIFGFFPFLYIIETYIGKQ